MDGYAQAGYLTIARALFDGVGRDVELIYEGETTQKGIGLMQRLDAAGKLKDIAPAFDHVAEPGKGAGVVGFCFSGLMSWLTSTRAGSVGIPACCVGYYAGGNAKFASEEPVCPVMLHFGADNTHFGQDQVEVVRAAHPEVEIHLYSGAARLNF